MIAQVSAPNDPAECGVRLAIDPGDDSLRAIHDDGQAGTAGRVADRGQQRRIADEAVHGGTLHPPCARARPWLISSQPGWELMVTYPARLMAARVRIIRVLVSGSGRRP
jgi:hypothetical protein